jgi:hypothetical protein
LNISHPKAAFFFSFLLPAAMLCAADSAVTDSNASLLSSPLFFFLRPLPYSYDVRDGEILSK